VNTTEILQICRMVKAFCPSQQFDQYTPDAWTLVLSDQPFEDAKQAIVDIARAPLDMGKSRYIEPGHIIGVILRIRARRLAEAGTPSPPAGLDADEYLRWHRQTNHAIATGTLGPLEVESTPADPERVRAIIDEALPGRRATVTPLPTPQTDDDVEAERARQLAAIEAVLHEA